MIDVAAQPLSRLLTPECGEMLREKLADIGVTWDLGTSVAGVDRDGAGMRVTLAKGESFTTDVVLSAIGLRPKLDLAKAAGLAVNRGIVVDRLLQTSAPDVFALDDCAEVCGLLLPFVMPIMNVAGALGATLAGKPTPVTYPAMPVVVKTPACPTIVSPPAAGADGKWEVVRDAGSCKALFRSPDGRLLGFALNGTATAERAALAKELPPVLA